MPFPLVTALRGMRGVRPVVLVALGDDLAGGLGAEPVDLVGGAV